jgi:taurine dioxygenase
MHVTKLTEHIGAEVTDVDLSGPVDSSIQTELYKSLVENLTLVVRDQKLDTVDRLLGVGKIFGELMDQAPPQRYWLEGNPLIRKVTNVIEDVPTDPTESRWHSDETIHERPPKFTILYPYTFAKSGGGSTSFANMQKGYESLPDDVKKRIADMKTVNVFQGSAARGANKLSIAEQAKRPGFSVLQPLVRTNADSGAKSLYFHTKKTENIVGMEPEESQQLLEQLIDLAVKPEYVYTHRWQPGDLVIWDDRSTLHKANNDYNAKEERTLYRMLVRGERPV